MVGLLMFHRVLLNDFPLAEKCREYCVRPRVAHDQVGQGSTVPRKPDPATVGASSPSKARTGGTTRALVGG